MIDSSRLFHYSSSLVTFPPKSDYVHVLCSTYSLLLYIYSFRTNGILTILKIVKRICITEEKNPRRIVQEGIMMTRRQIQRIEERAYLAIPKNIIYCNRGLSRASRLLDLASSIQCTTEIVQPLGDLSKNNNKMNNQSIFRILLITIMI